ncbi:hypothetical protein [Pseudodesulfovibrio piezophilus]|nr:hypothetical protein [Pseudodesulfovibrio piezophilus]
MEIITETIQAVTLAIHRIAPGLSVQAMRSTGAIALGILALFLLIRAIRLFRGSGKQTSHKRYNIPRILQQEGATIDILNSLDQDGVAIRCVITSASSGKIHCEIIERLDTLKIHEGNDLICLFAPLKTDKGKTNSFTAKLIESDKSGRKTNRIILTAPREYTLIPRRKHSRKKVADQQFIRVKLWVEDARTSDIPFEDAAAQIAVNSFTDEGPGQSANAVINISNGGLGLSVQNSIIPETCAVGSPVVINLFMFNFREKSFKPYWYFGKIRTLVEGRPGFSRMGIQFKGMGEPSEKNGVMEWEEF